MDINNMDKTKLSFKEYLDLSKKQLREALNKVPQKKGVYNVRKYCKLVIGESKNQKQYIPLKPYQKLHVDFLYENVDNPTVQKIQFEGVKTIDSDKTFQTYWDGKKLLSWLEKNTNEISN